MALTLSANFEKEFSAEFRLKADLAFPVEPGSITVLFGPSGAGKSTILRVLAGLDRPHTAMVRLGDEVWVDTSKNLFVPPKLRQVGMVAQHPSLFPHKDVGGNIAYGLRGLNKKEIRNRVIEVLGTIGLQGFEHRRIFQLSGGQARRVELARALAPRPRLLLLDEPFAGLDQESRDRIRKELRRSLKEAGSAGVLVTHDRDEALMMAEWIVLVVDGTTPQSGPIEEVLRAPRTIEVARILGYETIVPARLVGKANGIVRLDVSGTTLIAADCGLDDEHVIVVIRSEEVALRSPLHSASPTRLDSARNHLSATVVSIERRDNFYDVTLNAGFELKATVTGQAIEEMGIRIGGSVEAVFKATAVRYVPTKCASLSPE